MSVTVTEPRFTPHEKALLLASRRDDRQPRGPHGHPLSVSTDPETRGRWRMVGPTTDFATQKMNRDQDAYFKRHPTAKEDSSLLWRVELSD